MWTSPEIQINMADGPFIVEYKYVKVKEDQVSSFAYQLYQNRLKSLIVVIIVLFTLLGG